MVFSKLFIGKMKSEMQVFSAHMLWWPCEHQWVLFTHSFSRQVLSPEHVPDRMQGWRQSWVT